MEWVIKLRESAMYWERRLILTEGKKDKMRVRCVRRLVRELREAWQNSPVEVELKLKMKEG